jgi:predicted nucleic acid-binding protein
MGWRPEKDARPVKKVLVDTSVWVDAFHGRSTRQTKLLAHLIDNDAVVTCPTIIQEILQGIRDDAVFKQVKDNLTGFEVLEVDPVEAAYGAASLYRSIRKQGVTIRKSNDCLIAHFSIFHKILLLHNDKDFDKIAQYSTLQTA